MDQVNNSQSSRLLTSAEAAALLGCSTRTLARLVAARRIASVRWGAGRQRSRVGFTQEHIDEFLLTCEVFAEVQPAPPPNVGARLNRRIAARR